MAFPSKSIATVQARKVGPDSVQTHPDVVVIEEPLEVRVVHLQDGEPVSASVAVTMRTPGDDFELAAGFLFTEGLIPGPEAITRISYCVDVAEEQQGNVVNVSLRPGLAFDAARLTRHFYASSSCGICGKASLEALRIQGCQPVVSGQPVVDERVLLGLPAVLQQAQTVFRTTGGLHAAALFDPLGTLVSLREDVGRHNAVDKVVGQMLLQGHVPLSHYILLVSGRAGFEIMQKAAMAGVPLVAAVGAPSSLALQTAQEFGMTLVAFLKSSGFNVYTGPERIRGLEVTGVV